MCIGYLNNCNEKRRIIKLYEDHIKNYNYKPRLKYFPEALELYKVRL